MSTEENYILGFNHGYLIGKHFPALMGIVNAVRSESGYIAGVQAGGKEYEREKRELELARLKDTGADRADNRER